ncbi:MAG: hypothetical protein H8E34_05425 [Bacteroidetes bacterium]|nr:hypothetical protein [Bacteroidota bacterium]MBL6944320.1 hypothetical protein [Bacteroidales bacterium]
MKPGILKRDLWPIGLLIGTMLPLVFFIVLYIADFTLYSYYYAHITDQFHQLYLLSLAANLFPIRHYLVKLRFEKTGMGILLVTIAAVISYFYMYYKP